MSQITADKDQLRASTARRGEFDLAHLIAPYPLDIFMREHWEKQLLYIPRADTAYYAELLTLADVDSILSLSGVSEDLRIVRQGHETPITSLTRPDRRTGKTSNARAMEGLYDHYRNGYTLILNKLEQRWAPLQRLARSLGEDTGARIQVNVYTTPAGNQGFAAHYDTHDVFIAQAHGSKRWRLHNATVELPLESQPHDKSGPDPGTPDHEIDLTPGDLLYLPRGTVHSAAANDTASVHLTIGIHPVLWSDVITSTLSQVFEQDASFRRGLPPGLTRTMDAQQSTAVAEAILAGLRASLSAAGLLTAARKLSLTPESISLPGHLTDLEQIGTLTLDTRVIRRGGLRPDVNVAGDVACVHFYNKTVEFPAHVAAELQYVTGSAEHEFTARDIPGRLDEAGRLVLLRTLVHEGLLSIAAP